MRKSMMCRSLVAIGVCLVVAGTTTIVRAAAESRPDLTGQWVLNRDLSTDPRQSAEGRRGQGPEEGGGRRGRPGGGGMPGGFGGGMRGGRPGGFGGGPGGDEKQMREQMEEAQQLLRDVPSSMVLTYNEPKFAIVAADGRVRTLYSDKRKVKTANGNAELQARWDGERLVAETKFGSLKVVETWALSETGSQLVVTAKMDAPGRGGRGDMPNLELRRVYDRVTDAEPR